MENATQMYTKHPAAVYPANWKIGEVYYLPEGHKPFRLIKMSTNPRNKYYSRYTVEQLYIESGYVNTKYNIEKLHKAVPTNSNEDYMDQFKKEKTEMTNLYEFNNPSNDKEVLFGTKLATNSDGKWVMEIKGKGDVLAVDKDAVKKVVPNTIAVTFLGSQGTEYHYFAPKGTYTKGEMFVINAPSGLSVVVVSKADVESEKATEDFTPITKILTETVDSVD